MIRGKFEFALIEKKGFGYVRNGKVCAVGAIALANGVSEWDLGLIQQYFTVPGVNEFGKFLIDHDYCDANTHSCAVYLYSDLESVSAAEIADLMRECAKELREKGS